MKANNGKGNNPTRDMWETPQWLWEKLNKQYNFQFDCCAEDHNTKTKRYASEFEYISYEPGPAWMNPPFSKANFMFKHFFEVVGRGVAIYRCDNFETKIWQKIIFPNATWIFVPNKRIAYEGLDGKGARFPSALIGYKLPPPKELEGVILIPNGINTKNTYKYFDVGPKVVKT